MDYQNLINLLQTFGLPTITITLIISIVFYILNKNVQLKYGIKYYAPIILGIVLYSAYDMIFITKAFDLRIECVFSGSISGVLSFSFSASFNRIINGKPLTNDLNILTVEGIIGDFVKDNQTQKVSKEIVKIYHSALSYETYDETYLIEEFFLVIKKYSLDKITDDEIVSVASLTVKALNGIKKL